MVNLFNFNSSGRCVEISCCISLVGKMLAPSHLCTIWIFSLRCSWSESCVDIKFIYVILLQINYTIYATLCLAFSSHCQNFYVIFDTHTLKITFGFLIQMSSIIQSSSIEIYKIKAFSALTPRGQLVWCGVLHFFLCLCVTHTLSFSPRSSYAVFL